jgi:hypothetical protein
MRFNRRSPIVLFMAASVGAPAAMAASRRIVPAPAASNHHCANEQPLVASKRIVIAREMTELSDIYVTCWRKTNKHRVVAKFPVDDSQDIAFRTRGEWVVWRYRRGIGAGNRDRMGSINAHTGRRGPTVTVPVQAGWPLQLDAAGGPAAQDVGDASVMQVYIASNGYYAWPVVGELPDSEGGGRATAMYAAARNGNDVRIDVGSGPLALSKISIGGVTLRWMNNGTRKHARLGAPSRRMTPMPR